MRTGLFTGYFANGRYAISIIATLHWNKKMFLKRLKSQICRLESSKEKMHPKFWPNSIDGFAVSETKKPPSQNFP